jgi:hypothetical protein
MKNDPRARYKSKALAEDSKYDALTSSRKARSWKLATPYLSRRYIRNDNHGTIPRIKVWADILSIVSKNFEVSRSLDK